MPGRRRVLAGAAAFGFCRGGVAAGSEAARVATVDWAVLETLLALDVVPVAAPELRLYGQIVVEPAVPAAVVDLGLRGSPNYEALLALAPDVIFSSNYQAWADAKLRLIAPVQSVSIYGQDQPPLAAAERATALLAGWTGREAAGIALVADVRRELDRQRERLRGAAGQALVTVNFGDARHVRVFGVDSMFGQVAARLGLRNAWSAPTRYSATAPVGIEMLAGLQDAWIVVIPPIPADAQAVLDGSRFWRALPGVRAGRVRILEPINPFGALPAARRFARLLTDALTGMSGPTLG